MNAIPSTDGRPIWSPQPKQAVALACPAYELLYGGQKGGAKSNYLVACWLPVLWVAHQQWVSTGKPQMVCRIVMFRKNIRDLDDLVVKTHEIYPAWDRGAYFNKNDNLWTFSSGATVKLAHLDGPDDHRGWNGHELIGVGFDEVQDIPEDQYTFICMQVRTGNEVYRPFCKLRCTANPGGRHGDWVKKRFIDPCPTGNVLIERKVKLRDGTERVVTMAFIPSALKDNKYLAADGQYEANLRATLPEHLVKRYLEGDWDVIDGAFFSSRVRSEAVFVKSKPLPGSWDVKFGLDWGASNPACTLWGALDTVNERIWIIDELHTPGINGGRYAEHMLDKVKAQQWSKQRKWSVDDFYGLIDKQAADNYGAHGASAANIIAGHGFRLFEANKDRKSGISQVLERLQVRADGYAGLVIMEDRCPMLKKALMSVSVDKLDSEDYDKRDQGAHALDALRFLLMDWPVHEMRRKNPQDAEMERWERYMKAAKREIQPARSEIDTGYG